MTKYDKIYNLVYNHIMDYQTDILSSTYESLPSADDVRSGINIPKNIATLQKKVNRILHIIEGYNNLSWKYQFIVFSNKGKQVFHTQDRKIFIPSGLIALAKTDDQLGFILAHEIAHWENHDIKYNAVNINISQNEINQAECKADQEAMKFSKEAKYRGEEIEKLLKRLESIRPWYQCENPTK